MRIRAGNRQGGATLGMNRISKIAGVLCALWLVCAAPAMAQSQPAAAANSPATAFTGPAPLNVVSRQLPNGLRVEMIEDHDAPVINLQMWYHVGSKDERPGHTGFAHLFEHLMFKGSAHVAPEEHSRIIEAAGGFDNAGTFDDMTVFWETFPSNYLERVLWLEADRMGSLDVSQENLTSEREVVKEERRVRVDNVPYGRVIEDLYAAAFTVHPYHHTTIGSMDDLDHATIEDVRQFFHDYYRPDNATVVIVGDFSADEAAAWCQKYFGGIPKPADPIVRVAKPEPPQTAERDLTKSYPNSPLPAVVIGYKTPAEFSTDYYSLDLASNILSGGESGRLYRKLVYEDQLAVQASGEGNFTEDPNLFFAIAVMNQGHTAEEGEKAIRSVLDTMKATAVSAEELQKAKNQEISGFILARETAQSKADALGRYTVIGKDPSLINTDLNNYLKVSAADIQNAARKYFVNTSSTVLLVEPPKSPTPGQPGDAEQRP
jgi:zinc protease